MDIFRRKIIQFNVFDRKLISPAKKTVLVGGCFDIFHYGHLVFLHKAKTSGDYLIVALESNALIEKKKRKPFHSQQERAEILAALTIVDLVLLLPDFKNDSDYLELVKKIKPKIIAVSEKDINYSKKVQQAKSIHAEIKIVTPLLKKFSSSQLIKQL